MKKYYLTFIRYGNAEIIEIILKKMPTLVNDCDDEQNLAAHIGNTIHLMNYNVLLTSNSNNIYSSASRYGHPKALQKLIDFSSRVSIINFRIFLKTNKKLIKLTEFKILSDTRYE